jgi:ABC-type branched-subunit amino acid transport system ATPase component
MTADAVTADAVTADGMTADALVADAISISFGGRVAVDHLSLTAPVGRITGLIGPNGAGKTTTFNACNGLVRPDSGTIRFLGRDITRASPATRAQLGLGRTFQRMEICEAMSARENVALGRESRIVGGHPIRHVFSGRAERAAITEATDAAIELCGIGALADRSASTLATGQRRLVELARVVCGGFRLLLLDEPSSGLDDEETSRFGEVLRAIVAQQGVGILLVEHDMALVMGVCEQISVLDFGALIFEGTPGEVQRSPLVRAAYLGNAAEGLGA